MNFGIVVLKTVKLINVNLQKQIFIQIFLTILILKKSIQVGVSLVLVAFIKLILAKVIATCLVYGLASALTQRIWR